MRRIRRGWLLTYAAVVPWIIIFAAAFVLGLNYPHPLPARAYQVTSR